MTTKLGQQTSQENKEGNNSDGSGKEEDASNSLPGSTQVRYKCINLNKKIAMHFFLYNYINFLCICCLCICSSEKIIFSCKNVKIAEC